MQQLVALGVSQGGEKAMKNSNFSRRAVAKTLLLGAFSGSVALVFGQEYGRARDLVAKVQDDLRRAADFTASKEKERDRYRDVQRKLSEFDRDLSKGHFDKGKLDGAIDELKEVMKENTLESHDRDALTADLSDLRTLRDVR
jgi:hypothetical protein